MGGSLSRRAAVRIISFSLAAVLVAAGVALWQRGRAEDYRRRLQAGYLRSLGELSSYLVNLSEDLEKGRYLGTPARIAQVSAQLWRESGGAKTALASLPMGELRLDTVYRFLSQVGDYAMALSKKVTAGEPLSAQEVENMDALRHYAAQLQQDVDGILLAVQAGELDLAASPQGQAAAPLQAQWEDTEQAMTGYPTLIYDGPFSDHLLNQYPIFTRGLEQVTPEAALAVAAQACGLSPSQLQRQDDEHSHMPCYVFSAGQRTAAVTQAGGLLAYLLDGRQVEAQRLSRQGAFQRAQAFLTEQGLTGMEATYYEVVEGVCIINYAATQEGVRLYPDLIKVGIALDDGSVAFYDARGYLNNHRQRQLDPPALTPQQAAASVSPLLSIQSSRLVVIPTDGQNERFCYEFLASGDGGQQLLVYVNAATGAEENLLLLIQTPNGTLTK